MLCEMYSYDNLSIIAEDFAVDGIDTIIKISHI